MVVVAAGSPAPPVVGGQLGGVQAPQVAARHAPALLPLHKLGVQRQVVSDTVLPLLLTGRVAVVFTANTLKYS